ncbi:hypothetical protein CRG98_039593 [Punica granatum]|uniref:Uncharacterized protein n=1 Tax=Punica granatum TaxID=22663 RepID=A0A2I0I895_PUNGR|nr:hypothetical protein CRG98_039593 [Punica granatum]
MDQPSLSLLSFLLPFLFLLFSVFSSSTSAHLTGDRAFLELLFAACLCCYSPRAPRVVAAAGHYSLGPSESLDYLYSLLLYLFPFPSSLQVITGALLFLGLPLDFLRLLSCMDPNEPLLHWFVRKLGIRYEPT